MENRKVDPNITQAPRPRLIDIVKTITIGSIDIKMAIKTMRVLAKDVIHSGEKY